MWKSKFILRKLNDIFTYFILKIWNSIYLNFQMVYALNAFKCLIIAYFLKCAILAQYVFYFGLYIQWMINIFPKNTDLVQKMIIKVKTINLIKLIFIVIEYFV